MFWQCGLPGCEGGIYVNVTAALMSLSLERAKRDPHLSRRCGIDGVTLG